MMKIRTEQKKDDHLDVLVPSLPDDILYEISTRLPCQSIGRFRLTSKQLNNMTYCSTFKKLHVERANLVSGFFMQYYREPCKKDTFFVSDNNTDVNSKLSFIKVSPQRVIQIEDATKTLGIVLYTAENIKRPHHPSYFVCKPDTKEFKKLPNPRTRFGTVRISIAAVKSKPNRPPRFKIVRLSDVQNSYCRKYRRFMCEIFESETWRWTLSNDIRMPHGVFFQYRKGVTTCGAVHSLRSDKQILAFDFEQESTNLFPLPEPIFSCEEISFSSVRLTEYEGKPAFLIQDGEDCVETWVMECYTKRVWSRRFKVFVHEGIKREDKYFSPIGFSGSDLIVLKAVYNIIFMNMKNGDFFEVRLGSKLQTADDFFPFCAGKEKINLEELGPRHKRVIDR